MTNNLINKQIYTLMINKFNNKKDEQVAHEALLAMVIIFVVIIVIDYVTM